MFCPNCGSKNATEQKFCRSCGLNLENSARSLLEQMPAARSASLTKREQAIEKFGTVAFTGLGLVLLTGVLGLLYYIFMLNIWSGKNIPLGIILMLLVVFGVMALSYIYMVASEDGKKMGVNPELAREFDKELEKARDTGKLLEEGNFQPASVTERTTDLLHVENKTRKFE